MPFNWHVYLSETGAEISPPTLFEHVRQSLQPIIHKGCVLEALFRNVNTLSNSVDDEDNVWWPAEVVLISGYLVLLKWCVPGQQSRFDCNSTMTANGTLEKRTGAADSNNCFWFDVKGSDWRSIRPFSNCGLSSAAWSQLNVPSVMRVSLTEEEKLRWLNDLRLRMVPDIFFEKHVLYHHETIRVGGYFECEHVNDPRFVWPVQVLMNVGGRVKLSWFGSCPDDVTSADSTSETSIFTLFYLHRRIHPLGWASSHGIEYRPPPHIRLKCSISNVDAFVRGAFSALSCSSPGDPCTDFRQPPLHEFRKGWKLEAVNPMKPYLVQPATVTQVFDSRYFLVRLDDMRPDKAGIHSESTNPSNSEIEFVAYANNARIMPVNASQLRGLHLAPPPGWPVTRPFTWTNYLTLLSTNPHPTPTNNGLLRASSASSLISTSEPLKDGSNLTDNICISNAAKLDIHNPRNHVIDHKFSAESVPFCPSESLFKGTNQFCTSCGSAPDNSIGTLPNSTSVQPECEQESHTTIHFKHNELGGADRFLLGMKLELVIPRYVRHLTVDANAIGPPLCTGTVTRIHGAHLLWVLPDLSADLNAESLRPIMVDARSTQLYPVGWSTFVGHPIIAPIGYENCAVNSEDGLPTHCCLAADGLEALDSDHSGKANNLWNVGLRSTHSLQYQTLTYECEEICPPLYLNTRCYLGPFLCKTSLETLPRRFGPGPITRVMQYLLTRLVSAAYKPTRVLRMFEADWATGLASAWTAMQANQHLKDMQRDSSSVYRARTGGVSVTTAYQQAETEMLEQRRSGMCVVLLRIRCPRRGVKIEAPVEVCCRGRAVEEFCRQISLALEACPHLISLTPPDQSTVLAQSLCPSMDILPSFTTPSRRSRDTKAVIRRELSFGSLMLNSTTSDCPSFCSSRLRSRNLDRLPGWKRRMFASLRQFGVHLPFDVQASVGVTEASLTGLRTRAALAAAQQQQPEENSAANDLSQSVSHEIPEIVNCIPGPTRRNRNHAAGRFRGAIRRIRGQRGLYPGADTHRRAPKRSLNSVLGINKNIHDTNNELHQETVKTFEPNGPQSDSCNSPAASTPVNHYWHNHIRSHNGFTNPESRVPVPSNVDVHIDNNALHPSVFDPYLSDSTICSILADAPKVTLASNPLFWTPVELASYLGDTDCREMWPWLAAEAVDGQAFMLLTLPVLHHLVGLRWEDAIRLARHVVSVKRAFMEQFGSEYGEHSASCSTFS